MKKPAWRTLKLAKDPLPAKSIGLWTQVIDYIEGPTRLRFKASGKWTYAEGRETGPEGDRNLGFPQDVLLPGAPLGALVGKIGGSSADKPDPTKQTVFAVGTDCVISVDEKTKGTLFLTMNDEPSQFDGHDGEIKVEVWEAPIPPSSTVSK
jgi:hypothetical protein